MRWVERAACLLSEVMCLFHWILLQERTDNDLTSTVCKPIKDQYSSVAKTILLQVAFTMGKITDPELSI